MWDLGTDRYLHFPVDFKMKADYCAWFVDSDYWKSPNEWDNWKYTDDIVLSSISMGMLFLLSLNIIVTDSFFNELISICQLFLVLSKFVLC